MRRFGFPKVKKVPERPQRTTVEAYFDGACWPNPGGHAAAGAVIKRDGVVIAHLSAYLGCSGTTNNVAEYAGLQLVLQWLLNNKISGPVNIYGDSDMVFNQMRGTWKCKKTEEKVKHYVPYYKRAKAMRDELHGVKFYWIPRDENEEADRMSRAPLLDRNIEDPDHARSWRPKRGTKPESLPALVKEQRTDARKDKIRIIKGGAKLITPP